MKAIIVTPGKEKSARLEDIKTPELKPDEILVKTIRVGIDGTDREINDAMYGIPPPELDFLVLGHEAVGEVIQIGPNIINNKQNLKVGDIVVPMVRKPDDCPYCSQDMQDMCIKGDYVERGIKGAHGYLSEYFVEVPKYLVNIPKEIENIAVLLEPLSVVEKGIRRAWELQKSIPWDPKVAVVLGLGTIGILSALILKKMDLDVYIYSIEQPDDPKVLLVKKVGINYLVATDNDITTLPVVIKKNIDFILEATGNSSVVFKAMSLIGTNGILCLTSITGGQNKITICADCLNLDLVLGNKIIVGSVNSNRIDFEKGVEDLQYYNQKCPGLLDQIITKRFTIDGFKEAIEEFRGLKAVIDFQI